VALALGTALATLLATPAAATGSAAPTSSAISDTAVYGARLPMLPIVAQGVSSANPAHLVRDRAWDFAQMRHAFNTVALLPGDPSAVSAARAAGLAVVLELDFKKYYFAGEDISTKVDAVVRQIQADPFAIAAIDVADRVNQDYSPAQAVRYLAATAGVFHRETPGIPVVVNVADWELTCGRPNQSSCGSHGATYQYETNAAVDQIYRSGYVDGFTIADNLKNDDVEAQRAAWSEARARWPEPFILWSTCSQLSFPDGSYPGSAASAARTAAAYMTAPVAGGADGLALWAWHQLYDGRYYSFLDKSGGANPLWTSMVSTARVLTGAVATDQVPSIAGPQSAPLDDGRLGSGEARGSSVGGGPWTALLLIVVVCVLAVGVASRMRQRYDDQLATVRHHAYARGAESGDEERAGSTTR
jgi:hypothetical protein